MAYKVYKRWKGISGGTGEQNLSIRTTDLNHRSSTVATLRWVDLNSQRVSWELRSTHLKAAKVEEH